MKPQKFKLVVLLEVCCLSILLSATNTSSLLKEIDTTSDKPNETDANNSTTDLYKGEFYLPFETTENLESNDTQFNVNDTNDKNNKSFGETTLPFEMNTKYQQQTNTSLTITKDMPNRHWTISTTTSPLLMSSGISKINLNNISDVKISKKDNFSSVEIKKINRNKILSNMSHVPISNLSIIAIESQIIVVEVPLSVNIEMIETKSNTHLNSNFDLKGKSERQLEKSQVIYPVRKSNIKDSSKLKRFTKLSQNEFTTVGTLEQSSVIIPRSSKNTTSSDIEPFPLNTSSINYTTTESSKTTSNKKNSIIKKITQIIKYSTMKPLTKIYKTFHTGKFISPFPPSLTTIDPMLKQKSPWKTRDFQLKPKYFENVCDLQMDNGYGADSFSSWYFNSKSGQCEWFSYHGEGGNGNRFYYRANCENSCIERHQDLCYRKDIVNCVEDWLQCKMESDVTCLKNAKRNNRDENLYCPPKQPICVYERFRFRKSPIYLTHRSLIPQDCFLPKDSGHCVKDSNSALAYHYESKINDCLAFLHSNCGGNLNRFLSKNDCMNRCAI